MLQAAIVGLILLGIYKFIDRNRVPEDFDPEVDWWMAFAFAFGPMILIMILSGALAILHLPTEMAIVGYLFYLIVPFCVLKYMLDFKAKRAAIYAVWVPIVAVSLEVVLLLILGAT
ncbi:hypothetical protein [Microbulbifer thermotolerans]|uniref:hypothetical protein n=1 Tax=Microbulbifer thermotolerans TaxID=252514 RepID=UPI0022498001|nr:hypothetical protein [Microbulbifer thermotolerans]MCX2833077.1 hypothetical protein [Microbulbifer thermotolerans]WKT60707.1 hypothetical protein Q2E61_00480 [Microbulbifer thermotolerans]